MPAARSRSRPTPPWPNTRPGQFEINLKHRNDAVLACDDAIFLKRAIKAIAENQGMIASFMAKPFVDQAGSGTHIHVSVLDKDGNNIFACTPDAPSDTLRHGVAGLQQVSKDCMLMFAPHANSYRRFVLNAFVPLNDCWGFNNRTVAMRIPHSDPENIRIEHRIAGADANPYLVTAAVLAGILHGLETKGDPGPPIVGNAYEQTEPRTLFWRDTINDFMASDFVEVGVRRRVPACVRPAEAEGNAQLLHRSHHARIRLVPAPGLTP